MTRSPSHLRARAGMGYVPQGREIFADLTVGQNIAIVLRNHHTPDPDAARDEVVALFPVLGQMWGRRGADLSGGQQQQLAIARALAPRPKLLILDEPTEGVQPSIVEAAIVALKGRMAILLVEQYHDFARSLADACVVLDRGRVALRGEGRNMEADGMSRFLSVWTGKVPAMTHHLDTRPENLFWGYFDATTPPVLEVDNGDEVSLDCLPARRLAARPCGRVAPTSGGIQGA